MILLGGLFMGLAQKIARCNRHLRWLVYHCLGKNIN
jgi:hypothetical protein